jgi:hypothetical protein
LRDRLAAGRRVLAPLTKVRILVPQPHKIKGLRKTFVTPFVFNGILYLYCTCFFESPPLQPDIFSINGNVFAWCCRVYFDPGVWGKNESIFPPCRKIWWFDVLTGIRKNRKTRRMVFAFCPGHQEACGSPLSDIQHQEACRIIRADRRWYPDPPANRRSSLRFPSNDNFVHQMKHAVHDPMQKLFHW